jgi:regulator of protease activity HflC (stomatin/prohibitin superfamily)
VTVTVDVEVLAAVMTGFVGLATAVWRLIRKEIRTQSAATKASLEAQGKATAAGLEAQGKATAAALEAQGHGTQTKLDKVRDDLQTQLVRMGDKIDLHVLERLARTEQENLKIRRRTADIDSRLTVTNENLARVEERLKRRDREGE